MTEEEKKAAELEAAKAKKRDTFLDNLAGRVAGKLKEAEAKNAPPKRDAKPDPILQDTTVTGDEDLDEFIFGEKPQAPAAAAKPEEETK